MVTSDRRGHYSPAGQRIPLYPARDRRGNGEDPLRPSLGHAEISWPAEGSSSVLKGHVLTEVNNKYFALLKKVYNDTGEFSKMSASIHKHSDFPFFLGEVFECFAYLVKDSLWGNAWHSGLSIKWSFSMTEMEAQSLECHWEEVMRANKETAFSIRSIQNELPERNLLLWKRCWLLHHVICCLLSFPMAEY